jgi:hypothetical protein
VEKTRAGKQCRAYPLHGSSRCAFHDPNYRPRLLESASKGGRGKRRVPLPLPEQPLDLTTTGGVRAALKHILELQFNGQLSHRQGIRLNRLLQTAANTVDTRANEIEEGDALMELLYEITPAIREQYRRDYRPRGY